MGAAAMFVVMAVVAGAYLAFLKPAEAERRLAKGDNGPSKNDPSVRLDKVESKGAVKASENSLPQGDKELSATESRNGTIP